MAWCVTLAPEGDIRTLVASTPEMGVHVVFRLADRGTDMYRWSERLMALLPEFEPEAYEHPGNLRFHSPDGDGVSALLIVNDESLSDDARVAFALFDDEPDASWPELLRGLELCKSVNYVWPRAQRGAMVELLSRLARLTRMTELGVPSVILDEEVGAVRAALDTLVATGAKALVPAAYRPALDRVRGGG